MNKTRAISLFTAFAITTTFGVVGSTAAYAADGDPNTVNIINELAGDFSVLSFGDLHLGNAETEGSIATFEDLYLRSNYPLIHTSGLTPTNYTIPEIDGDPTRIVVGGAFQPLASQGLMEVSSRGTTIGYGFTKIRDTSNLAINERGNGGIWLSAVGTSSGTEPAIHIPEFVKQEQAFLNLKNPIEEYFQSDLSDAKSYSQVLADSTGAQDEDYSNILSLNPGSHGGEKRITLVKGKTNYLNLTQADSGQYSIAFDGDVVPDLETALVVNIEMESEGNFSVPSFAAANNTNGANPNTVAPYVIYNIVTNGDVTLTGSKISGSILAPNGHVTLNANSPIEGQIIGDDITTYGGEIHHYKFSSMVNLETVASNTEEGDGENNSGEGNPEEGDGNSNSGGGESENGDGGNNSGEGNPEDGNGDGENPEDGGGDQSGGDPGPSEGNDEDNDGENNSGNNEIVDSNNTNVDKDSSNSENQNNVSGNQNNNSLDDINKSNNTTPNQVNKGQTALETESSIKSTASDANNIGVLAGMLTLIAGVLTLTAFRARKLRS